MLLPDDTIRWCYAEFAKAPAPRELMFVLLRCMQSGGKTTLCSWRMTRSKLLDWVPYDGSRATLPAWIQRLQLRGYINLRHRDVTASGEDVFQVEPGEHSFKIALIQFPSDFDDLRPGYAVMPELMHLAHAIATFHPKRGFTSLNHVNGYLYRERILRELYRQVRVPVDPDTIRLNRTPLVDVSAIRSWVPKLFDRVVDNYGGVTPDFVIRQIASRGAWDMVEAIESAVKEGVKPRQQGKPIIRWTR